MKYVVKRVDIGIEKENILPIVVDAWEKLSPPLDFFKQDNIVYSNASYK